MENKITLPITKDNLPLTVREHLMRGQQELAINDLVQTYGLDKTAAEQLIDDYRAALRERKIELDIIMMNDENARDADEMGWPDSSDFVCFSGTVFGFRDVT